MNKQILTNTAEEKEPVSIKALGTSLSVSGKALESLSQNILDNPDCINDSVVKLVDTMTEALTLMAKNYRARVEYMRSQQGSDTND